MDKRNNGGDVWIDPFAGDVTFGHGADTVFAPTVDRTDQMGCANNGRSGLELQIWNVSRESGSPFLPPQCKTGTTDIRLTH